MEIVNNNWRGRLLIIFPYIIIVLALAGWARQCEEGNIATASIDAATSKPEQYTNELGTLTTTIKALQLDKTQLQDNVIKKDAELAALSKEFAYLQSVVKATSVTRLPPIGIKFDEPIPQRPCDSITVPFRREGPIRDKWYSLNYKVTADSLKLDSLTIPTQTTILTGVKRTWFLGKETVTTDITNTNPYIHIEGLQSAQLVIPEPWYKKWYLWLAAGLAGGLLLK